MNWNNAKCWTLHLNQVSQTSAPWASISKIFHSCWFPSNFGWQSRIWLKSWPEVSRNHRRGTPKPHLSLHKSLHIFFDLWWSNETNPQSQTGGNLQKKSMNQSNQVRQYAEIIHSYTPWHGPQKCRGCKTDTSFHSRSFPFLHKWECSWRAGPLQHACQSRPQSLRRDDTEASLRRQEPWILSHRLQQYNYSTKKKKKKVERFHPLW